MFCVFTLKPHRSWFALLLPEVVDPQEKYKSRNNAEREMKKLRGAAIPPSSLSSSERREDRRAEESRGGVCVRVCVFTTDQGEQGMTGHVR